MKLPIKALFLAMMLFVLTVFTIFLYPNKGATLDLIIMLVPQDSNSENKRDILQSILNEFKKFMTDILNGQIVYEYNSLFFGLSVQVKAKDITHAAARGDFNVEGDTTSLPAIKSGLNEALTNLKKVELETHGVLIEISEDSEVRVNNN